MNEVQINQQTAVNYQLQKKETDAVNENKQLQEKINE